MSSKIPRRSNPLAPSTYLLRNASKTIPLTGVIVLAVLLVFGIISLINSIPLSIRTIYSYSSEMLGLTPRGEAAMTERLVTFVKKNSPVEIERVALARASLSQVQSIVGKWDFAVLALGREDLNYYLKRQRVESIVGRLPNKGQPEAIISEPVARNLGLKMGDALLGPTLSESYSPFEVKIVGIAKTERWLMAADRDYYVANHYPPIDAALVFAKNPAEQEKLDRWADDALKGKRAQVLAYFKVERETELMFTTLYKILDVVVGTLVLVITFMMGMLINIYQSQRLIEFGLLQAIGYTKKQLLSRVVMETAIVVFFGWGLGLAVANGLLKVVQSTLMYPKAYAISTWDMAAFKYTLPVPIAILLVAVGTVILRFRNFDPVSIVERRLV